jgi:hypothetical protein
MAIYHFSVKTVARSAGRSATAAIAYRAGEKIYCEREGREHDYSRKTGVEYKEIYLPKDAPEHLKNRERLWNEVEQRESFSLFYFIPESFSLARSLASAACL